MAIQTPVAKTRRSGAHTGLQDPALPAAGTSPLCVQRTRRDTNTMSTKIRAGTTAGAHRSTRTTILF